MPRRVRYQNEGEKMGKKLEDFTTKILTALQNQ